MVNASIKIMTFSFISAIYIGCAGEEKTESTTAAQVEGKQTLDLGKAVAKVNGIEIGQKALDVLMENSWAQKGITSPELLEKIEKEQPEAFAKEKKQMESQLIDNLIMIESLRQEAMKSDVPADPEVRLKIDMASKQIIIQAYLKKMAEAKVTEEDLKKEYDTVKEIKFRNNQYEFTEFIVESSEDAEAVKALIASKGDVIAKLTELGVSGKTSAKTQDDYYKALQQIKDQRMLMQAKFEVEKEIEQIEATETGAFMAEPQEIIGKYHFRRKDKQTEGFIAFDEVKSFLKNEAMTKAIESIQSKIRTDAEVVRFDDSHTHDSSTEKADAHAGHNH